MKSHECHGVWHSWQLKCLFKSLSGITASKSHNLHYRPFARGICRWIPSQRVSCAESVVASWRHIGFFILLYLFVFTQVSSSITEHTFAKLYVGVDASGFSSVGSPVLHTECDRHPVRNILRINTLRPKQNGCRFPDDIFKCIFFNENVWISLKISLKIVPNNIPALVPNNIPAFVQIMAWRRPGDKPLSEPMIVRLLTHVCITRLQWVKLFYSLISNIKQ